MKPPAACPSCQARELSPVATMRGPAFARVTLMSLQDADSGRVLAGGSGFVCRPLVCRGCGFLALYTDIADAADAPEALAKGG